MDSIVTIHNDCGTITVVEAARRLGIGKSLAYSLAAQGKLPVRRFGGRVLVLRAPFEKMLELSE